MSLFKRVDTLFLAVANIEDTYRWYVEVLGFAPGWQAQDGSYRSLRIGETSLTLYQAEEADIIRAPRPAFNFFATDAEEARRHLLEHGVTCAEISHDDVKWFTFLDPEGNVLEVCSFPE